MPDDANRLSASRIVFDMPSVRSCLTNQVLNLPRLSRRENAFLYSCCVKLTVARPFAPVTMS